MNLEDMMREDLENLNNELWTNSHLSGIQKTVKGLVNREGPEALDAIAKAQKNNGEVPVEMAAAFENSVIATNGRLNGRFLTSEALAAVKLFQDDPSTLDIPARDLL